MYHWISNAWFAVKNSSEIYNIWTSNWYSFTMSITLFSLQSSMLFFSSFSLHFHCNQFGRALNVHLLLIFQWIHVIINMFQLTKYYKQREKDIFFGKFYRIHVCTLRFNVISILYEIVSIFISGFSTLIWCYISGLLARII